MPGLSQYNPNRKYKGPNAEGIYEEDPTFTGEWSDQPTFSELETAKQSQRDAFGFANPARSFGDQVFHGMNQTIPSHALNNVIRFVDNEDNEVTLTFRDIMELAKRLSPLHEGGPLYERQNP